MRKHRGFDAHTRQQVQQKELGRASIARPGEREEVHQRGARLGPLRRDGQAQGRQGKGKVRGQRAHGDRVHAMHERGGRMVRGALPRVLVETGAARCRIRKEKGEKKKKTKS